MEEDLSVFRYYPVRIVDKLIACREFKGGTWDRRSYVGVAFAREGRIVTGLLDYMDPRVAIPTSHLAEDDYELFVYHVFVALYLERIAKAEPLRYEVFRFHRDAFKYSHEDCDVYGQVLATCEQPDYRVSFSIERLPLMPDFADTAALTDAALADNLGRLFLPCPVQLAEEPTTYRPTFQQLPHPGLAIDGLEHEAQVAEWFPRGIRSNTYVN